MKTSLAALIVTTALTLQACAQDVNSAEKTAAPAKAKNVILFVGDGMGVSTVTATRIFDGQSKGMSGEENVLSFEEFPHVALVKTYNLDAQVADSAGTASAMNTGIKTQIGKINVTEDGNNAGCSDSASTPPTTIADLAEAAGLSTGIISTARITHATPAAVYGHASSRGFESDTNLSAEAKAMGCSDLAAQLIDSDLDLVLGGGARSFDPEKREDKSDLMQDWANKSQAHVAVKTVSALRRIEDGKNVLGLFTSSHMSFEADRKNDKEPSIAEMTTFAIKNLDARDTGYFLMVEGGRIDHAHHGTNAYRALTDAQAFAVAVQAAVDATDPNETLIMVTADHSHVFTIAGYPQRGNPILGLVKRPGADEYSKDVDGKPYTTLGYHNGPNTRAQDTLTDNMVQEKNYQQQTAIKLESETHAGEDVALYASGPGAQEAHGVIDQTEIFDIMAKALGLNAEVNAGLE